MSTQLIECIPNFSEARRPEIIDQIVDHPIGQRSEAA